MDNIRVILVAQLDVLQKIYKLLQIHGDAEHLKREGRIFHGPRRT